MTIHADYLWNYIVKPPLYRFTKIIPTFGGWHRVNVYAEVLKEEPNRDPVWGLSIVKSFVIRDVDGQYMDFHHTTPPEVQS